MLHWNTSELGKVAQSTNKVEAFRFAAKDRTPARAHETRLPANARALSRCNWETSNAAMQQQPSRASPLRPSRNASSEQFETVSFRRRRYAGEATKGRRTEP